MSKFTELLKELRIFIALIVTVTGTSILNTDIVMDYISTYNIHLGLITIVSSYLAYFLNNKRINCQQEQITHIVLNGNKSQLKAEVRQAYKDYKDIKEINFLTSIKYLQGLEERRISLELNSYTEEMMSNLLKKIKL